jgi:hypothetical protein
MKNYELRITNYKLLFAAFLSIFLGVNFSNAQSTSQSFPTAVTTNEISGQIKARDIGDSRSTAYFYTFNAVQGDVFVNVVTNNFNGDIDVFAVEGLKSLTKIVVYADSPSNETGRVIYLRKPEKLLLRIEGRSPNDDAATFRIKFAGSFQALSETDQTEQPKLPEVSAQNDNGIVVNSVGTIISVKPKPTPAPKEVVAEKEVESGSVTGISVETEKKNEVVAEVVKSETGEIKEISLETATEKEIVADNQPKQTESSEKLEVSIAETASEPEAKKEETLKPANTKTKKPRVKKPTEPNPLENVRLIVLFKDGTKIERPMSEVLRVNVDGKGMLTIVSKDGSIERHSILDVAKFTIE